MTNDDFIINIENKENNDENKKEEEINLDHGYCKKRMLLS